jgi:hypothetical protein
MDQELATLHQQRGELERKNQSLSSELQNMKNKYVRKWRNPTVLVLCLKTWINSPRMETKTSVLMAELFVS